jgi:diguanylate cyclase (GGDEF)-like protein
MPPKRIPLAEHWLSISKTLMFRIIAASIVVIVLGSLARYHIARDILTRGIQDVVTDQQLSLAQYAADDIDSKIRERQRQLLSLAEQLPTELLNNPQRLEAWLAQRHQAAPLFSLGLVVVPYSGRGAVADFPVLGGRRQLDFSERDWFLGARDKGVFTIGKPTLGRASYQSVITMGAPILDKKGQVVAVLLGVTASSMPGFLDQIQNQRIGKTGSFLLFSPEHQIIVTATETELRLKPTPKPGVNRLHDQAMIGWRGAGITVSAFGVETLAAFASVPSANWVVVARIPTKEAFRVVDKLLGTAVRSALVAGLVFAIIIVVLLIYIFRPLKESARQMHQMALGELPLAPLPVRRQDEVGEMVTAFNALVNKVMESDARMAHIAHHDALTGLPNRRAFLERLQQGIALSTRQSSMLGLLFLDLDGFKQVNDQHGHAVGDKLLQQVAARLQTGVRLSDTVGRLGGDEFMVLLADCVDRDNVAAIAQKLISLVSEPYVIDAVPIRVGVSIGIALLTDQIDEPEKLITMADAAMYEAKRGGRNTYRFHQQSATPQPSQV